MKFQSEEKNYSIRLTKCIFVNLILFNDEIVKVLCFKKPVEIPSDFQVILPADILDALQ